MDWYQLGQQEAVIAIPVILTKYSDAEHLIWPKNHT